MRHYLACACVNIHDTRTFNLNNYNNDALDPDGCQDVVRRLIADCDDDGITLKSTSQRPCEKVSITGCVVSSHCNVIKLGTETSDDFCNINKSAMGITYSFLLINLLAVLASNSLTV